MNDPVVLAVVAVVAAAAGFGIGFVARSVLASQTIRAAQDKAARIVAEARAQQKELILQAKDEQVKLAREAEEDAAITTHRAFRPREAPAPARRAA